MVQAHITIKPGTAFIEGFHADCVKFLIFLETHCSRLLGSIITIGPTMSLTPLNRPHSKLTAACLLATSAPAHAQHGNLNSEQIEVIV